MPFIDTHCHLSHPDYNDDLKDVLQRAEDAGVTCVICAGYDMETSERSVVMAKETQMIRAAVGVHPNDADTFRLEAEERLRELAADRKFVVAIGETGLDYHHNHSPRETQHEVFRKHIDLAREFDLPLIVHSRDAQADVLAIMKEMGLPPKGAVMHCIPADPAFARGSLELGCFLGIAGNITFKNAGDFRELVGTLPIDRLLLETDAPYLTPHPYRGKRNEPARLTLTAAVLAETLGMDLDTVMEQTSDNARRLFSL
jgi:TatD DNase family protein